MFSPQCPSLEEGVSYVGFTMQKVISFATTRSDIPLAYKKIDESVSTISISCFFGQCFAAKTVVTRRKRNLEESH